MASEVSDLWRVLTPDGQSPSGDFTIEELTSALQQLKPGKAAGPYSISPELILHVGFEIKPWLCELFSFCLRNIKIWKRALVVAILKPNKLPGNSESYQPTSLLCIPFKILECLIYARIKSTINPLLPREQAGF